MEPSIMLSPKPSPTTTVIATLPDRQAGKTMRYPCLHGLRGVLSIWVMLHHLSPDGAGLLRFTHYGYLAVDVFFALSGFVLMEAHRRDFRQVSLRSAIQFYARRAWRTYPVHVLSCSLAIAVSLSAFGYVPDPGTVVNSLLLFDTWSVPSLNLNINTPIWSLRVEWVGYIVFPWLCHGLLSMVRPVLAMAATGGVIALEVVALYAVGGAEVLPYTGIGSLIRMAGGFLAGCLLWLNMDRSWIRKQNSDDLMIVTVVLSLALLLFCQQILFLFMLPMIIVSCVRPGRITLFVLGNLLAIFLGRISFSLYLCHYPIMRVAEAVQNSGQTGLSGKTFSVLTIVTSVCVAYLSCRFVEEPVRAYGRHRIPSPRLSP